MAKESLGVNNNVTDALFGSVFEGLTDSQWGYRGFKTRPDFVRQRISISPKSGSTTPGYDSTQLFEIPKRAAILRRLSLRWRTAALAQSAGSNVRFVDYYGFAAIRRSVLRYASNDIHEIQPMELYLTNRLDHRRKDQEAIARLAGGDLTNAERATLAAGVQNWTTHLPFHFSELPDKCIYLESLGYPLEVEISLDSFVRLTDADGSPTTAQVSGGAISNFRLEAELIHLEDYERDYHVGRTLSDQGLVMAVREHRYQPAEAITSSVQDYTYRLTNLKGACYEIRWVIQSTLDTAGSAYSGRKDYFNFVDFSTIGSGTAGDEYWYLDASGIEIVSRTDAQWNIEVENRDLHSGDSGDAIYGQAFGFHPEDRRNCTGHKTWAGMTNPAIVLRFNGNTPSNLQITAISREYNAQHNIQGEIVKLFK